MASTTLTFDFGDATLMIEAASFAPGDTSEASALLSAAPLDRVHARPADLLEHARPVVALGAAPIASALRRAGLAAEAAEITAASDEAIEEVTMAAIGSRLEAAGMLRIGEHFVSSFALFPLSPAARANPGEHAARSTKLEAVAAVRARVRVVRAAEPAEQSARGVRAIEVELVDEQLKLRPQRADAPHVLRALLPTLRARLELKGECDLSLYADDYLAANERAVCLLLPDLERVCVLHVSGLRAHAEAFMRALLDGADHADDGGREADERGVGRAAWRASQRACEPSAGLVHLPLWAVVRPAEKRALRARMRAQERGACTVGATQAEAAMPLSAHCAFTDAELDDDFGQPELLGPPAGCFVVNCAQLWEPVGAVPSACERAAPRAGPAAAAAGSGAPVGLSAAEVSESLTSRTAVASSGAGAHLLRAFQNATLTRSSRVRTAADRRESMVSVLAGPGPADGGCVPEDDPFIAELLAGGVGSAQPPRASIVPPPRRDAHASSASARPPSAQQACGAAAAAAARAPPAQRAAPPQPAPDPAKTKPKSGARAPAAKGSSAAAKARPAPSAKPASSGPARKAAKTSAAVPTPRAPKRPLALSDLLAHGKLTAVGGRTIDAMFDACDLGGDGVLDCADVSHYQTVTGGEPVSADEFAALLAEYGGAASGSAGAAPQTAGLSRAAFKRFFTQMLEEDGDAALADIRALLRDKAPTC